MSSQYDHQHRRNIELQIIRSQASARADAVAIENWFQVRRNQALAEIKRLETIYNENIAESAVSWAQQLAILHDRLADCDANSNDSSPEFETTLPPPPPPGDFVSGVCGGDYVTSSSSNDFVASIPVPRLERQVNEQYHDPLIGDINLLPDPVQLDLDDDEHDSDDAGEADYDSDAMDVVSS
jgi:hypothetical protein